MNKGFRGKARSWKSGQPGHPGSYEEALNKFFDTRLKIQFLLNKNICNDQVTLYLYHEAINFILRFMVMR